MDFAHEFEAKVKSGLAMTGGKITLQEFSERWMAEYAKVNLQPGTVTKYRQELNDKILPALGHLKLSELRPHRVNSFFTAYPGRRTKGRQARRVQQGQHTEDTERPVFHPPHSNGMGNHGQQPLRQGAVASYGHD